MTALTADAALSVKDSGSLISYAMADNVHIYKFSLVNVDTSGYARPATDTALYTCVGVAYEDVDNTTTGHTAGGKSIRVMSGKVIQFTTSGATQAKVGQPVYVTDSGTVGFTSTNSVLVGLVVGYTSATQVWVFVPVPVAGLSGSTGTLRPALLGLGAATAETYSAAVTIANAETSHRIAASNGTAAASTFTTTNGGADGDILIVEVVADSSGTCTITFGTNFKPSATLAVTASHFAAVIFKSDGTNFKEQSRSAISAS